MHNTQSLSFKAEVGWALFLFIAILSPVNQLSIAVLFLSDINGLSGNSYTFVISNRLGSPIDSKSVIVIVRVEFIIGFAGESLSRFNTSCKSPVISKSCLIVTASLFAEVLPAGIVNVEGKFSYLSPSPSFGVIFILRGTELGFSIFATNTNLPPSITTFSALFSNDAIIR